jgi:hypothetical protein
LDEDKLQRDISAGDKAEAMLQGGPIEPIAFSQACALLSEELIREWKVSKSIEAREKAWACINLLEKLGDTLTIISNNGKMAKEDLNRLINSRKK